MISTDNIPENLKADAGSMTVAEIKEERLYNLIVASFPGYMFHNKHEGKCYIMATKNFINDLQLKYTKV